MAFHCRCEKSAWHSELIIVYNVRRARDVCDRVEDRSCGFVLIETLIDKILRKRPLWDEPR